MNRSPLTSKAFLPVCAVVAVMLQIILAPNIAIRGVVPNLILVVVVLVAMRSEVLPATVAGFLLGLVFDLVTAGPVGGMSLIMALLAYSASSLKKDLFEGNWVAQVLMLLVAAFAGELLHNALYSIIGYDRDFFASLLLRALPGALYDSLFGLILFPLLQRFTSSRKGAGSKLLKGGLN
ncbi:MAG: rod shape-determining protein MreD [Coriobacteriales bacterium]|jgi:rod shape-determining protein MreD|nr:rod shape-determining protein MreD [Coriobacteriales bacterium]